MKITDFTEKELVFDTQKNIGVVSTEYVDVKNGFGKCREDGYERYDAEVLKQEDYWPPKINTGTTAWSVDKIKFTLRVLKLFDDEVQDVFIPKTHSPLIIRGNTLTVFIAPTIRE